MKHYGRQDTYRHQGLRNQLVTSIHAKGISDVAVLTAMEKVPRHLFFDSSFLEYAYEDKPFPIGAGQTISQPYTVAFQTALLKINKGDKILEIGTGSGYQACILAEMGAKVFSIERQKTLFDKTRKLLPEIGYPHIKLFYGDGYKGLPPFGPFDKVLVTAAATHIPEPLIQQLKLGGILVIPVGEDVQVMISIRKISETEIEKKEHGFFRFVPMLEDKARDH
jgi:protein-L-isoaspartate(D-aspartate) O-methyltransferase